MSPDPIDRHRPELDELDAAILGDTATLPSGTRRAAALDEGVPDPFGAYVATIHRHADRVTDATVRDLAAAGADDDAIFEISVAAAYGAARARLDAGLGALRAARGEG